MAAGSYTVTAQATDDNGAVTTSASINISVAVPADMPHGVFYIHPDHLGTPRVVTDESDRIVWQYDLLDEPFGNAAPDEDPDGDGRKFVFNLRFPGQYYDKETGLNYNYHRDYDPVTGRYIESDPIGLKGGINTYGYVVGEPVGRIDPKGLDALVIIGGKGTYYDRFGNVLGAYQTSSGNGRLLILKLEGRPRRALIQFIHLKLVHQVFSGSISTLVIGAPIGCQCILIPVPICMAGTVSSFMAGTSQGV